MRIPFFFSKMMRGHIRFRAMGVAVCFATWGAVEAGAQDAKNPKPDKPTPTHADVKYAPHERNVLDFWQAGSAEPTPLVVYIHGGGFRVGSKEGMSPIVLKVLLGAGISVASINYRYATQAPIPAPHHDGRRALQFLRSKADAWNIDTSRVGAFGNSAGAQICMYLAFHDDMADPKSDDPLERESTRLACVGTVGGQTTMDADWFRKNIPGYQNEFARDLGGKDPGAAATGDRRTLFAGLTAMELVSADDPAIFMRYKMNPDDPMPEGEAARYWKIHHVQFGVSLKERMDALGLESHLVFPKARDTQFRTFGDFFIARLKN